MSPERDIAFKESNYLLPNKKAEQSSGFLFL
jgi:hypothetical protein